MATFWHLFTELEPTVFEQMIESVYRVWLRDHCKGGPLAPLTSQDHSLSKVFYNLEQLNNFSSLPPPTRTSLFSLPTQAKPTLISPTLHHFIVEIS